MLNFVLRANLRTQVMSGDFFSVSGNDVGGKFADGGVGAGESTHTPVNLNWREWFYHRLLKIALFFCSFFIQKLYYLRHRSNSDGKNVFPMLRKAAVVVATAAELFLINNVHFDNSIADDLCNLGHGKCRQHSDSIGKIAR